MKISGRLAVNLVFISVIIFLVVSLVIIAKLRHHKATPSPTSAITSEGTSKYWWHGDALLPNPDLSPGEVRTTNADEVCNESTRDFRDTPESMKRRVYAKYDQAPHKGECRDTTRMTRGNRRHPPHEVAESCEIDHIIPLELGGADTEANLFPQPYNPPGGLGAHAKDRVENYLHNQVCYHGMPLAEAQKKIQKDWYQVYLDTHLSEK